MWDAIGLMAGGMHGFDALLRLTHPTFDFGFDFGALGFLTLALFFVGIVCRILGWFWMGVQ